MKCTKSLHPHIAKGVWVAQVFGLACMSAEVDVLGTRGNECRAQ